MNQSMASNEQIRSQSEMSPILPQNQELPSNNHPHINETQVSLKAAKAQFNINLKFIILSLLFLLNITYTYYTKQSVVLARVEIKSTQESMSSVLKQYNNFQINVKNAINRHVKIQSEKIAKELTALKVKTQDLQKEIKIKGNQDSLSVKIQEKMKKYENSLDQLMKQIKSVRQSDKLTERIDQIDKIVEVHSGYLRQSAKEKTTSFIDRLAQNKLADSQTAVTALNDLMAWKWLQTSPNPYLVSYTQDHSQSLKKQNDRLQKKYNIKKYAEQQLSFCTILLTRNNMQSFEYQNSIDSILHQNYTNNKLVIIDDGSNDSTPIMIDRLLKNINLNEDSVKFIKNSEQKGNLASIQEGVSTYCNDEDIAFIVHGGDLIVNQNVFNVFNAVYQKNKAKIVYSGSIHKEVKGKSEKINKLMSFKVNLFKKINPDDFKNKEDEYLKTDYVDIIYPMMTSLSCKKPTEIKDLFYLPKMIKGSKTKPNLLQSKEIKSKIAKYKCITEQD